MNTRLVGYYYSIILHPDDILNHYSWYRMLTFDRNSTAQYLQNRLKLSLHRLLKVYKCMCELFWLYMQLAFHLSIKIH